MTQRPSTTLLMIMDGWGHSETNQYNAINQANTPNWDHLLATSAHTFIHGSGENVGLPEGQMGNSEVGHLNIGAGRIIYQEFTRISKAISSGEFYKNPVLAQQIQNTIQQNKAVHILGLLSTGGVHSHEDQIFAVIELAAQLGSKAIYLHAFLDGRDTPPKSAAASLTKADQLFHRLGVGKIASVIGRYYAMDRDKRWDRVQKAYDLLTQGKAEFTAQNAETALAMAYERGETDEFVHATRVGDRHDQPTTIQDGDCVIFMNYRADRARELTYAFLDSDFTGFLRGAHPALGSFVTLTQYAADIDSAVAYPPTTPENVLGEYIAKQDLKQLRIAETEKYAHVTFFINGGIETVFPGEKRILVPSPKVATYDEKPEMSAVEVTDHLVAAIKSKEFALIICNYANPDMVGHTGDMKATIRAIETIDTCLGRIINALKSVDGAAIITADHGNAECMYNDELQQPHTAHTENLVPVVYYGRKATVSDLGRDGNLADIAPTLLAIMNLQKPAEMTGLSLFKW